MIAAIAFHGDWGILGDLLVFAWGANNIYIYIYTSYLEAF